MREHREAARPMVADKDGQIVKTMDNRLLLEIPSVFAAVERAVAIQKVTAERATDASEAKRFAYRIGFNLGDVCAQLHEFRVTLSASATSASSLFLGPMTDSPTGTPRWSASGKLICGCPVNPAMAVSSTMRATER